LSAVTQVEVASRGATVDAGGSTDESGSVVVDEVSAEVSASSTTAIGSPSDPLLHATAISPMLASVASGSRLRVTDSPDPGWREHAAAADAHKQN
jgi:hypothetical protein